MNKPKLTAEDRALLIECFKEADKHRKILRELCDARLAEKFGVSRQYVNEYRHLKIGMLKGYGE